MMCWQEWSFSFLFRLQKSWKMTLTLSKKTMMPVAAPASRQKMTNWLLDRAQGWVTPTWHMNNISVPAVISSRFTLTIQNTYHSIEHVCSKITSRLRITRGPVTQVHAHNNVSFTFSTMEHYLDPPANDGVNFVDCLPSMLNTVVTKR